MPAPDVARPRRLHRVLRSFVRIEAGEVAGTLWAAGYFFCLLASYYMVRPARDSLGISRGPDALKWLFTATFVATLAVVPFYTWLVGRLPRARLLPLVYRAATASLLLFACLLATTGGSVRVAVGYAFFVWLSVYNLLGLGAVFWAFMADVHTPDQGKRLFGTIAAGGTLGAVVGSATARAASGVGVEALMLVAAVVIEFGVFCLRRIPIRPLDVDPTPVATLADAFRGARQTWRSRFLAGIALFTVLDILTSTYLYHAQGGLARRLLPAETERTAFFANVDLGANSLVLLLELAVVGRVMLRFGVAAALVTLPLLTSGGIFALALAPTLMVLGCTQVLRRGVEFGLAKPAREVLFTTVSHREKYEAKAFIDTVVNRGTDALLLWLLAVVPGGSFGDAALWTLPLTAIWIWLSLRLASAFARRGGQS